MNRIFRLLWAWIQKLGIEKKVARQWLRSVPPSQIRNGMVYDHYGRYVRALYNPWWIELSKEQWKDYNLVKANHNCDSCCLLHEGIPCHCAEGRFYFELVGRKQGNVTSAQEVIKRHSGKAAKTQRDGTV